MNGTFMGYESEMVYPTRTSNLLVNSFSFIPNRIRVPNLPIQQPCDYFDSTNFFISVLFGGSVVFALLSEDKNEWR